MLEKNLNQEDFSLKLNDFLNFEQTLNPNKTIKFKHYKMYDYIDCYLSEVNVSTIKFKLEGNFSQFNFFPGDPIMLNIPYTDEVIYHIDGKIDFVQYPDPVEITIKVDRFDILKNFRRAERFPISLSAEIFVPNKIKSDFSIVRNISERGLKVYSKKDLEENEIVNILVLIDKINKFICKCRVVRKGYSEGTFAYGMEICSISEEHQQLLNNFIKNIPIK